MPKQHINRTMAQRRALMAECKRRMQAGECSTVIMTSLQIPKATFYRWSKVAGFRRGDVAPDDPRARTRSPAGPSAGTSSGVYLRGGSLPKPPGSGRRKTLSDKEAAYFRAHPFEAWMEAQRARDADNAARVNAIIKALRQEKTQANGIRELWQLAREDPDFDHLAYQHECMERWSSDELTARCLFHEFRKQIGGVEPPIHAPAPAEWQARVLAMADQLENEKRAANTYALELDQAAPSRTA